MERSVNIVATSERAGERARVSHFCCVFARRVARGGERRQRAAATASVSVHDGWVRERRQLAAAKTYSTSGGGGDDERRRAAAADEVRARARVLLRP